MTRGTVTILAHRRKACAPPTPNPELHTPIPNPAPAAGCPERVWAQPHAKQTPQPQSGVGWVLGSTSAAVTCSREVVVSFKGKK